MAKAEKNSYYQNPKEIIELFKSGSVVEIYNQFDTTMLKKLSPRRLEPIWFQMQRNYGEYVKFAIKDTIQKPHSIIINTDLVFKHGIMNMMLSWDINSNKINGFFLTEVQKEKIIKENNEFLDFIDTTKFTKENIVIDYTFPIDGELTTPVSDRKYEGTTFILVAGDGRQSKDVQIGPNKVFKNLAWALSSFGHSVIRYDKVNYKYSKEILKDYPDYTFSDEYVKPLISVINKAKSIDKIKNNRIILVGYDEGVKAVTDIVSNKNINGLILLMGTPTKQYELEIDKLKYIFNYDNVLSTTEKSMIKNAESKIEYYKSIDNYSEINKDLLPLDRSYDYLKSIDTLDPIKSIINTNKPVLIMNSNNDFEIREKHYQEWDKLSTNNNISIVNLEKIDHLMRMSNERSHPKLYRKEAPISTIIFEEINQWIKLNE